jgi:CRISPR-associated endonuclease Cas1
MAATKKVAQRPLLRKSGPTAVTQSKAPLRDAWLPLTARSGVITLFGYGISIRVDRGHLILNDGVGDERRQGRFARVNHGIRRVVVIGTSGLISLAALRWLADQNAAFVMLERDGSVLAATGPVAPSDARLRRAQACVALSDAAVSIVRDIIEQKLIAQEGVAREKLTDSKAADLIAKCRLRLAGAATIPAIRFIESQGSAAYWCAWQGLTIDFPKSDLRRVPEHWRNFGSRTSPVSHGARNAANPANAMLNYLYTILEAETRMTIAALGLDPGLGLLHIDAPTRDSLACDLMEPVRPSVDAFLVDFLRSPLKREWFFEQRDGTCRLMPALASRLGETALIWRAEVAPIAEWFAQAVCSTSPDSKLLGPRSRLTRQRWRESMQRDSMPTSNTPIPEAQSVCRTCGAAISQRRKYCKACAVAASSAAIVEGAKKGRAAAVTPEAMARRRESGKRQNEALQAWNPADQPAWLTNEYYTSQIQPRLIQFTRPRIAEALSLSSSAYAGEIRNGKIVPHPRHWLKLAELAGIFGRK